MPRNEDKLFTVGDEKPTREPGEVLPSVKTLFHAKKIFLFCEGKTEFQYFSEYKEDVNNSRLEIIPRYPDHGEREGNDVEQLAKQLMGSQRKVRISHSGFKRTIDVEDIDEFFILFDFDKNFKIAGDGLTKYQKARILTEGVGVEFFLSNYCFEVWILCHFIKPSKRMKKRSLNREIMKCSDWSKYRKGQEGIYLDLRKKLEIAKENALELINEKKNMGISLYSDDSNPFTEIPLLLEKIEKEII